SPVGGCAQRAAAVRNNRDGETEHESVNCYPMNLLDALELLNRPIPEPASEQGIFLECGFTPLHLKTFLAAQLRLCFPKDRIEIKTGLYGDLAGNLERVQPSSRSVVCV